MLIKSPHPIGGHNEISYKVFLAGSIEMGVAVNWQNQVELAFQHHNNIVLYNPRRDDWDSSWKQDINNPSFKEQVDWELDAMNAADLIIMYFAPDTQSPITLLELGLYAASKKLIVCCPDGFWRKGNVDVVCNRYDIRQVNTIDQLIEYIHQNTKAN